MSRKSEDGTTEWCAGMPLVLRRPFEAEEQQSLQREAVRRRWCGAGILALFPILIGLFALAATRSAPDVEAIQTALAVCAIALTAVCLPVQILVARDSFRRSRGLFRDLRAGFVKRFVGPLGSDSVGDETLLQLRKAGLFPDETVAEGCIEVLPASGRVWRVMGNPVRPWVVAQTVEVAETPPFAALAAQWLQPVAEEDGTTLLAGQRELSQAEQEELRRYARRLWLRRLPLAAGMTFWISMPIAVILRDGNLHNRGDWIRFVFLAVVTIATDVQFLSALRQARQFGQDIRQGSVFIVRVDESRAEEITDHSLISSEAANESGAVELLPVSRWVWTEAGRPAAWRMVRP